MSPDSFDPCESNRLDQKETRAIPRKEVTTAAMEAFVCLAEQCEDSCCRDWSVAIDQINLEQIRNGLAGAPGGSERLDRLVILTRPSGRGEEVSHIQLDETGACPLLETTARCSVQNTLGERALPTACSVFPRAVLAVQNRLEVNGSLACPEVARLVLLAQDPPVLQPASKPMLARAFAGKPVAPDAGGDPYAYYFDDVRALLLGCFAREGATGTRLMLGADFAERVRDFFHSGTLAFDGDKRASSEALLAAHIEATKEPSLLAAIDRDLKALSVSGETTVAFVVTLLLGRKGLPHSPRFANLLRLVFSSVQEEALGGHPIAAAETVSPVDIWKVYDRRRVAIDARLETPVAHILSNYSQHFLLTQPFTESSTLLEYLYKLGVHLAAIRLLIVGHPAMAARLMAPPNEIADRNALNETAVHVIQTFTKAIGHHPEYQNASILKAGATGNGFTFGQLVLLSKFL